MILLDLALASERMLEEVLEMVDRPVVVSHTGVKGVCDNNCNLSDKLLRKVAKNGGLVGIDFWKQATGSGDVEGIVRSIRCAVDRMGAKHVGIGSDFDGTVQVPFDVSHLSQLTGALLNHGFGKDEICKIMGGNFLKTIQTTL